MKHILNNIDIFLYIAAALLGIVIFMIGENTPIVSAGFCILIIGGFGMCSHILNNE